MNTKKTRDNKCNKMMTQLFVTGALKTKPNMSKLIKKTPCSYFTVMKITQHGVLCSDDDQMSRLQEKLPISAKVYLQ